MERCEQKGGDPRNPQQTHPEQESWPREGRAVSRVRMKGAQEWGEEERGKVQGVRRPGMTAQSNPRKFSSESGHVTLEIKGCVL